MRALIAALAALCMVGCDAVPYTPPAQPKLFTCAELIIARDAFLRGAMNNTTSETRTANAMTALALESALGQCLQ